MDGSYSFCDSSIWRFICKPVVRQRARRIRCVHSSWFPWRVRFGARSVRDLSSAGLPCRSAHSVVLRLRRHCEVRSVMVGGMPCGAVPLVRLRISLHWVGVTRWFGWMPSVAFIRLGSARGRICVRAYCALTCCCSGLLCAFSLQRRVHALFDFLPYRSVHSVQPYMRRLLVRRRAVLPHVRLPRVLGFWL